MNYQKMAERIAPLVHAMVEGKTLQFRDPRLNGMWEDVYSEGLHFYEDYEYRIKPQSLKAWRSDVLDAVQGYTLACIEARTASNGQRRMDATATAQVRHDKLVALLDNTPKED